MLVIRSEPIHHSDSISPVAVMLSPHEFTTLMLLNHNPDLIDPDRIEIHTLMERRLAALEPLASGSRRPRITPEGHAVLQAVARIR